MSCSNFPLALGRGHCRNFRIRVLKFGNGELMKLKVSRTRNGVGIVKVRKCPICGRTYKPTLGKVRLVNAWPETKRVQDYIPASQCGAHLVLGRKR